MWECKWVIEFFWNWFPFLKGNICQGTDANWIYIYNDANWIQIYNDANRVDFYFGISIEIGKFNGFYFSTLEI